MYCSHLEKDGAGDPLSLKRNKESGYYIFKGIITTHTEAVLMIVLSIWTDIEMGGRNIPQMLQLQLLCEMEGGSEETNPTLASSLSSISNSTTEKTPFCLQNNSSYDH